MGLRDRVIKKYLRNQQERGDGDCLVIMRAGKWEVPRSQRPKLAPPPKEMTEAEKRVYRMLPDATPRAI